MYCKCTTLSCRKGCVYVEVEKADVYNQFIK